MIRIKLYLVEGLLTTKKCDDVSQLLPCDITLICVYNCKNRKLLQDYTKLT